MNYFLLLFYIAISIILYFFLKVQLLDEILMLFFFQNLRHYPSSNLILFIKNPCEMHATHFFCMTLSVIYSNRVRLKNRVSVTFFQVASSNFSLLFRVSSSSINLYIMFKLKFKL